MARVEGGGHLEGEQGLLDVEVGGAGAHAEEEGQADLRLSEGHGGGRHALVGLELLDLDAGQSALVDHAGVAELVELQGLGHRVLDRAVELQGGLGEDHLGVGLLDLRHEVALGVGAGEAGRGERGARGPDPEAALAGGEVHDGGVVGEADWR